MKAVHIFYETPGKDVLYCRGKKQDPLSFE